MWMLRCKKSKEIGFLLQQPLPFVLSLSKDSHNAYPTPMRFYAYMLRCNDGSYYTGHTDNLEARIAAHNTGSMQGYTADRLDWNAIKRLARSRQNS